MARVILPVRSRLGKSAASTSQSQAGSTTSLHQVSVFDTRSTVDESSHHPHSHSTRGVSGDEDAVSESPLPSIERSPSPASTANTYEAHSPVVTPIPSISDGSGRNFVPTPGTQNRHVASSTGRQSSQPSLSISPPPSIGPTTTSSVAASTIKSMEGTPDLGGLRLSSRQSSQQPRTGLNMRDIGVAIDGVVRGEDTRPASASLAVPPLGPSRRRSSPRPEPVIHRVEDEEPPNDEFHDPNFQGRMSQARAILRSLASILSSSSMHLELDSTVRRHQQEAESLSRFQPLATRTVGLVGESGVGKSSLINSLLDRNSLARTTGRGSACTCVVTEYHFHAADNYVIDVEMFSEDELCDQLAELLGSYRAGTGEEAQEKAEIAIDTFRSMFRGRLQEEEWILTEAEDVVLDQFGTWAKETRRLGSPGTQVAETLEQCSSLLVPLSSEPNDPLQPSLWPYIRKIKVYLNTHILSKGLILVDLPGLRDLNSARRNITQEYVVNCHEIFAICSIKRATTDVGVKIIFDIAQQAWLERVGIICTNADDINLNEVDTDWNEEDARPIRELKRSLQAIERDIETINAEIATFEGIPDDDVASQGDKIKFFKQKVSLENAQSISHFRLQHRAISTRNRHVEHDLRTEYAAQARGETLNVFCVSNKMYHDKRNSDKSISQKYLVLSGIIEVRKHLVALVGESQLRASRNFLERQVPALLRDVEIWVQSGAGSASAEEKRAIRDVLFKVEKRLEKGLTSRRSAVTTTKRCLNESFETRIWEVRRISKWTASSRDACMDWDQWNAGSYAAWLRKKGEHETKTVPYCNWNRQVIEDMAIDTSSTWEDLLSDIRLYKATLKQSVAACWEEAGDLLESDWPDANDLGEEIVKAMDVRKGLLLDKVEGIFDRFDDALSNLRRDTLTWLYGSMIRRIMFRVCQEAMQHSGNGCTVLRQAVVKRTFAHEGVFRDITRELRQGFKGHVERLQQELDELVLVQLYETRATFNIAREENAVEEHERDPEFRQRVVDEVGRARGLMGM